ncbi:MAG: hypothetical protein ABSB00_02570 [Minisyncoccia bacterium]|jgi:hypothetical protein
MNNQKNNLSAEKQAKRREAEKRLLPFAVEFVKFFIVFAVIIAIALLALHFAVAAMQ